MTNMQFEGAIQPFEKNHRTKIWDSLCQRRKALAWLISHEDISRRSWARVRSIWGTWRHSFWMHFEVLRSWQPTLKTDNFHLTRKVWNSCTIHFQDMIHGISWHPFYSCCGSLKRSHPKSCRRRPERGPWLVRSHEKAEFSKKSHLCETHEIQRKGSICIFPPLVFPTFKPLSETRQKGSSLLPAKRVAGALSTKEFANPSVFTVRARRIGIAGWSSFAARPCGGTYGVYGMIGWYRIGWW